MLCPACSHDKSLVLKTREDPRTGAIDRVRECRSCAQVWRTREDFHPKDPKTWAVAEAARA